MEKKKPEPFFVLGILIGAFLAANLLKISAPIRLHPDLVNSLKQVGIKEFSGLMPQDLF
jgi:hypothetical protein